MASGDVVPPPTTYPPYLNCTLLDGMVGELDCVIFNVTDGMVNFLNLTGSNLDRYISAYCLAPPGDDSCLFGFCPNLDIAGPLVRIASELTQAFGEFEPRY